MQGRVLWNLISSQVMIRFNSSISFHLNAASVAVAVSRYKRSCSTHKELTERLFHSQRACSTHREPVALTGNSQRACSTHRESIPLTERLFHSQRVHSTHGEPVPLTRNSSASTKRGPGRLKCALPSTSTTCPSRTARSSFLWPVGHRHTQTRLTTAHAQHHVSLSHSTQLLPVASWTHTHTDKAHNSSYI